MNNQRKSQTTWFTIVMLIVFFPIGIYLMWKNKKFTKTTRAVISTMFLMLCIFSYIDDDHDTPSTTPKAESTDPNNVIEDNETVNKDSSNIDNANESSLDETVVDKDDTIQTDDSKKEANDKQTVTSTNDDVLEYNGEAYRIIEVDGGDLSGHRDANVAVDIGFGERVYWGLTNEHGQLVTVLADKIILQDDKNEPVTSKGRYYSDEAKVPGVERADLDEGHIIADSLGGVSNAYNITPQNSTLNRHGNQAYMEKVIRDAGGCENFVATITYPDTSTQIPSTYKYEYVLKGRKVVDEFDNINPDKENNKNNQVSGNKTEEQETVQETSDKDNNKLSDVDTNGNGKVTIAEAKAAGYRMPISSNHWLYQYMDDRDGDGLVGE